MSGRYRRWSRGELRAKWAEQDGRCFYCPCALDARRTACIEDWRTEESREVRGMTVDHFVPRASGGPDNGYNTVLSCAPCNFWKADRPPRLAEVVCFVALRHPDSRWLMVLVAMAGTGEEGAVAEAFRDALARLAGPEAA